MGSTEAHGSGNPWRMLQADAVSLPAAAAAKTIARLRGHARLRLEYEGGQVQIQVARRANPRLAVLFHGAVKPERRQAVAEFNTPKLASLLDANVVAVADPSLACSESLTAAWYLGHANLRSQRLLAKLFRQIQERLKIERTVYVGGSAGGFAALYYSWVDPGSVAVAVNPQTSLSRHRASHQAAYRSACWPDLDPSTPLSTVVHEDLCALYQKRVPNSVVYLQNSMDAFHVRNHLAPFLSSIRQGDLSRVVPEVRFWGVMGHSNSIPRQAWFDWTRAALDARATAAVELLEARAAGSGAAIAPLPDKDQGAETRAAADMLAARQMVVRARSELPLKETP